MDDKLENLRVLREMAAEYRRCFELTQRYRHGIYVGNKPLQEYEAMKAARVALFLYLEGLGTCTSRYL